MTIEKRCTVEPPDFLALVFECGKCGAAIRLPVARIADGRFENVIARDCNQCGEPTGVGTGTMEYVHLVNFSLALRQLADTVKGRNLKVKLELKCADLEAKP